jgi:UDP-N-acetylmuramoyl-L-alanyl-D-glutamate--2,6-diaminopimelate ligase
VTADSRQVQSQWLFVAIPGTLADGHEYIDDAIGRGAALTIGERDLQGLEIPYLRVPDTRKAYAALAASWHGNPARELIMIGVTGTDGKTTTASLLYKILQHLGFPTGMITSVNAHIGDQVINTGFHVTTPDAMDLQGFLSQMLDVGIDRCIVEATSHGLAQHRVAACEFDLGIVTNITHEHLDFHGSYHAYREAKGLLFRDLGESDRKPGFDRKVGILNCDDESYPFLEEITVVEKVGYGNLPSADVRYSDVETSSGGVQFIIQDRHGEHQLNSPLLGGFNVHNLLAAYTAAVYGFQLDPASVVGAIEEFSGVPGRMESFQLGQPFIAMVDFAHTPNALKKALEASRELCRGRIIAVFGSAGLRDREKRRLMAQVSAELADITILTAEDPRTESLEEILQEMADGSTAAGGIEGETFWRINDRADAIRFGLGMAQDSDLVIVCGKGHEQSMCFGTTEHPWDDRIAMKAALSELLRIEGPAMPWLPTSGS